MEKKLDCARVLTPTVGRSTKFELFSKREYSFVEIAEAQMNAGYHPNGYGEPYDLKITQEDQLFKHTWNCLSSCD